MVERKTDGQREEGEMMGERGRRQRRVGECEGGNNLRKDAVLKQSRSALMKIHAKRRKTILNKTC